MKPIKTLFLLASLSAGISILLAQPTPPARTNSAPAQPGPGGAAPAADSADEDQPDAAAPAAPPAAAGAAVDPVLLRMQQKAAAERGDSGGAGPAPMEEPAPVAMEPGAAAPQPAASEAATDSSSSTNAYASSDGIVMNFRDAQLDQVLDYLSRAAGFVIVKEVRVSGRVNVVSHQPLTKDEAVELLNSELYRNGCGAIRNNRTLTIVSLDEIKTRGIPVKLWDGDPESIPKADVMVTMVLPVRFVTVAELLQNIIPLVNPSTPLTANQSGNSLIITDTENNVRRIAEIIKAVDSGAEDVTVVKVFTLKFASPQEVADELMTLFASNSRNGGTASAGNLAVPMAFAGGGRGGRGGATGGGQARMRQRTPVVAVPDMRSGLVAVTASSDQMDDIEKTIQELDASKAKNQDVEMFTVENVDPVEALQVLTDIFSKNGTSVNNRNNPNQNSAVLNRQTQGASQFGTSSRSGSSGFGGSTSGFGGSGGGGGMGGGGRGGGGGGFGG